VPGQGVCDLYHACGVRDRRKTIPFLGKTDAGFACLAATYSCPFSEMVVVHNMEELRSERQQWLTGFDYLREYAGSN
jgi:hypothetical protein